MSRMVLELTVNNHPGVMSHVAGLFARRAFNIEGILCGPLAGGDRSRMYLLVERDGRSTQLLRQLEKLHDVIGIRESEECDGTLFGRLDDLVAGQ